MEENANNKGNEGNFESAEYRANLLRKLNCLISVVEVALAKVRVNLQTPGADLERLTRIRLNLENTLNVCRRAKLALERKEPMPAGLPGDLSNFQATVKQAEAITPKTTKPPQVDGNGVPTPSYRDYVEFSSLDEYHKFRSMPVIRKEDVKSVDLDDLARKLGGVDKTA